MELKDILMVASAVLICGCIQQESPTASFAYQLQETTGSHEQVECYASFYGVTVFDGVPYTKCKCDGIVVAKGCGMESCDPASYICEGAVTGYTFTWRGLNFHTIDEWESQCHSFTDEQPRQECLRDHAMTKRVLERIRREGSI